LAANLNGILFLSGKSLVVEDTNIRNFGMNGIAFKPIGLSTLVVTKTTIADNALNGVLVQPSGSNLLYQTTFKNVEAYNNEVSGITLDDSQMPGNGGRLFATISDCTATDIGSLNSTGTGFRAQGNLIPRVLLAINRSVAAGYSTGIQSNGPAALAIV